MRKQGSLFKFEQPTLQYIYQYVQYVKTQKMFKLICPTICGGCKFFLTASIKSVQYSFLLYKVYTVQNCSCTVARKNWGGTYCTVQVQCIIRYTCTEEIGVQCLMNYYLNYWRCNSVSQKSYSIDPPRRSDNKLIIYYCIVQLPFTLYKR